MCAPWYETWIILLMGIGAAEQAQQSRYVQDAQSLRVGMSREDVTSVMGTSGFDYRPQWDHWLYGSSIDLQSVMTDEGQLTPLPIRLRLFSYCEDDVVIRWGKDGKADRIDRPEAFEAPREFDDILDAYLFVAALATLFSSSG